MSIASVVIIGSPVLLTTAPGALWAALKIKLGVNVTTFAVDAGVQSLANAMRHKNIISNYNLASGAASLLIGVPEGAALGNIVGANLVNSTVGTSVNVSANSLFDADPTFSFHPSSIVVNTIFGSAAGSYAQWIGKGTGSNTFGDAAASPINFAGAVADEATRAKDQ